MELPAQNTLAQCEFRPLHEMEKGHIEKALEIFYGNKTQAATALGITIKTLYNKLHMYGIFDKYKKNNVRSRQ